MIDLNMIDWNKFFSNANVEEQVNILNDTLFNISSNFVRSKVITVDVKDPPQINEEIKCKIKSENNSQRQFFKYWEKNNYFEILDKKAV